MEQTFPGYWKKFEFGATIGTEAHAFRYLIACILVGGSAERNVLKCMDALVQVYPDPYELEYADFRQLADMIESYDIRFPGNKAKNIIKTAGRIRSRYNGRVPDERTQLEALPGVGRHVASVILATVYGQNEFAVDIHVKRISKRMGLTNEKDNERKVEDKLTSQVSADILGHFSRSFVDFGQNICQFNPICKACPFSNKCPSANVTAKDNRVFGAETQKADGRYKVQGKGKVYTINVENGMARCTCKAALFGRKCYHLDLLK